MAKFSWPEYVHKIDRMRATWYMWKAWFRSRSVQPYYLQGAILNSEERILVEVQGPPTMEHQLSCLLFQDPPARLSQLPSGQSPALFVRQVSPLSRRENVDIMIRPWLNAERSVCPSAEALEGASKDFRRAFRHLEKLQPTVSYTQDLGAWREWFDEMMVPTAQKRHSDRAYCPDFSELTKLKKRGILIQVHLNGEWIAGGFVIRTRWSQTHRLWRIGMRQSSVTDGKLYKGLNIYLDYLALNLAHQENALIFSLGETLARVDEGLFRYKSSWGCTLRINHYIELFAMRFASDAARRQILSKVPLLEADDSGLTLHIADSDSAKLDQRLAETRLPGVTRIIRYTAEET